MIPLINHDSSEVEQWGRYNLPRSMDDDIPNWMESHKSIYKSHIPVTTNQSYTLW